VKTLQDCDLILAEDTRTSGFLLKHLSISKPLRSYHQHNEHGVIKEILSNLSSGKNIALVSDAGTPGISDPGFLLIREAIAAGVDVSCLPGPVAFIPALVMSGLPCNEFSFYGFLPQKKGRATAIKKLAEETKTFGVYESPFRLVKLLSELADALGNERKAVVCREISKLYEDVKRGTVAELHAMYNNTTVKGEIVVIVSGKNE
jgi:16S rRNA (cytidine1402-2'-O)-methyltransferase